VFVFTCSSFELWFSKEKSGFGCSSFGWYFNFRLLVVSCGVLTGLSGFGWLMGIFDLSLGGFLCS
jgi:hypothetical protein